MSNASLNRVDARVHVSGAVRANELEKFLQGGRALVLMDCEGAEFELLDPEAAPSLANADIIVEVHPHRRPGIEETIASRFYSTHMIQRITQKSSEEKLTQNAHVNFSLSEARTAIDERRSADILWLFLQAAKLELIWLG